MVFGSFDKDELLDRVDDDIEFLEESVEMLEEDAPPLLEQIRSAINGGDAAALVAPAHTLKGMLSNFCSTTAEQLARELEERGRDGRVGDDSGAVVDSLAEAYESLRAELRSLVAGRR